MKEVEIKNYDGVKMTALIGQRVELDEAAALLTVDKLRVRAEEVKALSDEVDELSQELENKAAELEESQNDLNEEREDAAQLIEALLRCYTQNGKTPPAALTAFVAESE